MSKGGDSWELGCTPMVARNWLSLEQRYVSDMAALGSRLAILQWAYEHGCPCDEWEVVANAHILGNTEMFA